MANTQVVIASDEFGQPSSVVIWDLLSGTKLSGLQSTGRAAFRSLATLSNDYLISGEKDTQVIRVWTFTSKDQVYKSIIAPGKVKAMTATPDGMYCIVGIDAKIYIWQVASGDLLAVLERHYQPISCLKTTSDGSHFISASQDGITMVWYLPDIISDVITIPSFEFLSSSTKSRVKDPRHTWPDHSGCVTDVYVSPGGINSRVATVSVDQTCKIHELLSGTLLMTIVFEHPLWSVAMDLAENYIFVGDSKGNIYETQICPKEKDLHSTTAGLKPMFVGHSDAVTCLAVSLDGLALVSGSKDAKIKVWHIESKHCMRTMNYKGAITNLLIIPYPPDLNTLHKRDRAQLLPIQVFKRHMVSEGMRAAEKQSTERYMTDVGVCYIKNNQDLMAPLDAGTSDFRVKTSLGDSGIKVDVSELERENIALKNKVEQLREVNGKICEIALKEVFRKCESNHAARLAKIEGETNSDDEGEDVSMLNGSQHD